MVCAPVPRDNFRALARGLSTVQAYKPCSISLGVDFAHYRVSRAKDWVSVDCGTKTGCIERGTLFLRMLVTDTLWKYRGSVCVHPLRSYGSLLSLPPRTSIPCIFQNMSVNNNLVFYWTEDL